MKHPRSCRNALRWLGVLALVAWTASCSRREPAPAPYFPPPGNGELSVMSYNLRMYRNIDRDNDGQEDDFKPDTEINPLIEVIRRANPDILVLQELGDASTLTDLRNRLRAAGLDYPHYNHLDIAASYVTLGLLSRYPITGSEPLTNLFYSIQGRTFPVLRGFQQVDIEAGGATFRIVNVHLKAKTFHEAGQTEMRRNEARLLATQLRRLEREHPGKPTLVCGDFNDAYSSAAMRELIAQDNLALADLPLADPQGDRWTHYYQREDGYARIDYMLVNPAMQARWIEGKSGVIRDSLTYRASDHRPIFAVFQIKD